MFKSFLRFGSVLVNSTINTTIDALKNIGKEEDTTDLFKVNIDPEIDRELEEEIAINDLESNSNTTTEETSRNIKLLALTDQMVIKVLEYKENGYKENINGSMINFDLIVVQLQEPTDLLDKIYFFGKDIPQNAIWRNIGKEYICRLQSNYRNGELYTYLETLLASKDEADDFVLPIDDIEIINITNTANGRTL